MTNPMPKQKIRLVGFNRPEDEEVNTQKLEPLEKFLPELIHDMTRRGYHIWGTIKYRPMEYTSSMRVIQVEK